MNSFEITLRLAAGIGLILANGFFVAIEFALTRVRQYPESEFDTPGLRKAWEMTQNLEIYLTSCQVGISATSIAVGIVAEPALAAIIDPFFGNTVLASIGIGGLLAFVIINLLHLTHGEQTPTYLGVERTKFVARYGAMPLYWFAKLLSPVITLGDTVAKWTLRLFGIEMTGEWLETRTEIVETRADLRSVLERSDMSDERIEEILNAYSVGEMPVSEVMTPVDEITFLTTEAPIEENLDRIGSTPHTRFPLIRDEPDEFVGTVYIPAVIDRIEALRTGEASLKEIASEPMTVPTETRVDEAIDRFQEENQELAVVVDENDGVVGLVTATDALEVVVGEINDPIELEVGR
jgi:CBS domain containing-hemolysin-like protein